MRLEKKIALITGGNSGIGRACAETFAHEDATVVIAARNAETAHETVSAIEASGGTALFVACDVSQHEQCQQAVATTIGTYGQLDVLVNNAGIIYRDRNVINTPIEEWQQTLDVNLNGTFYMCKYALPHLITSKGNIINVASYVGLVGFQGIAAYCASKGAVVQLTRAMALDHAADGVRVNCVCPGSVDTPMIRAAWEAFGAGAEERWTAKHPLGRIATAQNVADAILYFASAESSFVTGVALPVDGGITAG
jgi:NAD(P)-dependent dehydrogenase (short-subunit alcohol dehydrogenase family)